MKKNRKPDIGKIETFHLDNGISIYIRPNSAAPVATVQAWVKTGSIHEADKLGCGLSHFLEHMLFQGTKNYSSDDITGIVHQNGGEMNAYTSFAVTCYYIELLSESTKKAIDILTDMLQTPTFKEETFKTEKDVILRECSMGNDNPDRKVGEKLWKTVFRNHPVRHPIIGYTNGIESVNRKMMVDYHRKRYTPERIFFVISGDVNGEEIAKHLEKRIGKMPKGNLYDPPIIAEPEQKCLRNEVFYYDDPMARLVVGYRVPDVSSPDIPALELLAAVLGHSKSSRLIKNIRDKKQLALNIDSFCYSSVFDGVFSISATTPPEKMEELKDAIFAEIENVGNGITQSEIEKVKKQLVTNLYRGLRSNSGIAQIIGNSVLTYGTPDYACKYMEDIEKVTPEDIIAVAEKYLDINKASVVEMLPLSLKKEKIKKIESRSEKIEPEKLQLAGNTELIYLENRISPLIDISLVFPGGTIAEGKELSGISRLTAKLLTSGTMEYSEEEFAELLDSNALSLHVSGGNNTFSVRINCHTDSLAPTLKALSSMLSEPLFSEDALKREKAMAIESLKTRKLSPLNAAEEKLCNVLYGDHPYAYPNSGMEQSIKKLTTNKIRDFYFNTILNREKMTIGIAGDISAVDAAECAEKLLASIPWSAQPAEIDPPPPVFPKKQRKEVVKLPKEQSVVMVGIPGCSNKSNDRFAMDIVQTSLNGLSTRLFKSIRDDAGLAYYTGLYSSRGIHDGFIAFYAGTAPETADEVLDLIQKEKEKLASGGLTKDEFNSAIARLRGETSAQKLNPGSILFHCVISEFYGNGFMEPWNICEKYAKLTHKELNKVIAKYFSNKKTVTVKAGS
jgi:zinc protease